MKAKLLNPLQENMRYVVRRFIDLVVKDSLDEYDENRNQLISVWFSELVLGYALTVASGNDTYLKGNKSVFDEHIERLCKDKVLCDSISGTLSEMIASLNA